MYSGFLKSPSSEAFGIAPTGDGALAQKGYCGVTEHFLSGAWLAGSVSGLNDGHMWFQEGISPQIGSDPGFFCLPLQHEVQVPCQDLLGMSRSAGSP